MGWERIAHTALSSTSDTIDTGTFTARKNMKVFIFTSGANTETQIRFNSDANQNYCSVREADGGAESNFTDQTKSKNNSTGGGSSMTTCFTSAIIYNIADQPKSAFIQQISTEETGSGTAPRRAQGMLKWENTSAQITSIQVINNSTGDFAAGSYITVWGAKEPATADTMTVSGFTAKKHLKAQMFANGTGGTINCNMTFNNDTNNNYVIRESINGGTDSTNHTHANTDNLTGTVTGNISAIVNITNESSKEKLFISDGIECATGAGSSPDRKEMVGKWTGSAQITTIKANNGGSGSYAEGSELIVWGSDGASDTIVTGALEDIVGGFIFEETTTGKHYIWNATTSTWTEIA